MRLDASADGQRLECAPVELFMASEYDKGGGGLWEIQCEKDHFEFKNDGPIFQALLTWRTRE
jgi:hypothetical protein